jgi:hypothetical protein
MECRTKDELEQHLSDIRRLATSPALTSEEKDAAVRAERFAIGLLTEHDRRGTTARDARSPHGVNDPRRNNPSGQLGLPRLWLRRWPRSRNTQRLSKAITLHHRPNGHVCVFHDREPRSEESRKLTDDR